MPSFEAKKRLLARRLAVRVVAAINDSGKNLILVTSPTKGAGKSLFVSLVAPELERVAPHRFHVLSTDELASMNPFAPPDDRVLLVDGPAMLEQQGVINIRQGWISAFEGSLVLVVGRKTRREDLEETIAWLNASKIPPIGIIWNELVSPSVTDRIYFGLQWVRGLFGRRPKTESPPSVTDSAPSAQPPK